MNLLYKAVFTGVCVLTAFSPLLADLHMESSDKANEGLLYHATFDNTLKPERSAGQGALTAFGPENRRFGSGIMNQGLRIGVDEAGEKFYAVLPPAGNIDSAQGTISFWFKPENWDGSCKDFNIFVSGLLKNNNLLIYKYGSPTFGLCTITNGKSTFKQVSSAAWKKGEWHHLAVVWSPTFQRVYLDSAPVVTESRTLAQESFTALYLGCRGWAVEKGTSILDEFKIFNRPLNEEEIAAEFSRFGKKENPEAKTSFTVGKKTVQIDGRIIPGEYDFQSTGFVNIPDGYAPEQTNYAISHDDKYIYVAIQAQLTRPPVCNVKNRDGNVYLDDSVEIWLANRRDRKIHQFILNTDGVLYDAMPGEKIGVNWNITDFRVASSVENNLWTLETAIDKAQLGGGNDWLLNLGRTVLVGGISVPTSLVPVRKHLGYSDVERYAELNLRDTAPVFRLKKLGNLNNGDLDLEIETSQSVTVSNITQALSNYKEEFTPENGKIVCQKQLAPGGKIGLAAQGVFQQRYLAKKSSSAAVQYIFVDHSKTSLQVAVKNESGEGGGKLFMSLKKHHTDEVVSSKSAAISGGNFFWQETLDIAAVPPGDYDFEARYQDNSGKFSAPFVQFFRKPGKSVPWQDNKIGIYPGEVPPPWKPLAVSDESIKSLLQTYQWDNTLFPAQMRVRDRNILAAPMKLVINGKELQSATVKCVNAAPDKVEFASCGTLDNIKVTCRMTVEFDGFMWVEMSLEGKKVPLNNLRCLVPLKKEIATQVHSCEIDKHVGNPVIAYTGGLKQSGWQKNLYEKSAFWVGNDDAGFAWFAENLVNWANSDRNRSAEILPGEKSTAVQLTMLDKPVELNGTRKYEFGMQLTPVKDYDPTPRTKRLSVEWGWGNPCRYFDYKDSGAEFFNKEAHDKRRQPFAERKERYFLYAAGNGASPYAPEWAYFAEEWTSNKIGDYYIELQLKDTASRNENVWTYACLNSRSFLEFKLWQLNNIIADADWDVQNIYYDLVGPRLCANTAHGCGWKDDSGNMHPTFTVRGCREFHKRLYALMKKVRPDSMHYYHVTGQPALPAVSAFCNALVEGESFFNGHVPEKETYFGAVSPETFRVAYSAQKWGYQLIFIPQLERAAMFMKPERQKLWQMPEPPPAMDLANRHLVGYFYTHDVMPWGGGLSFHTLYNKTWQKQQTVFKPWDASVKFIGYWTTEKPFTVVSSTNPERVLVSAYVKGAKAMVAVVNDTDKVQNVEIAYPGKKSIEAFDGTPVTLDNGKFSFTIQPQLFNLFYLE